MDPAHQSPYISSQVVLPNFAKMIAAELTCPRKPRRSCRSQRALKQYNDFAQNNILKKKALYETSSFPNVLKASPMDVSNDTVLFNTKSDKAQALNQPYEAPRLSSWVTHEKLKTFFDSPPSFNPQSDQWVPFIGRLVCTFWNDVVNNNEIHQSSLPFVSQNYFIRWLLDCLVPYVSTNRHTNLYFAENYNNTNEQYQQMQLVRECHPSFLKWIRKLWHYWRERLLTAKDIKSNHINPRCTHQSFFYNILLDFLKFFYKQLQLSCMTISGVDSNCSNTKIITSPLAKQLLHKWNVLTPETTLVVSLDTEEQNDISNVMDSLFTDTTKEACETRSHICNNLIHTSGIQILPLFAPPIINILVPACAPYSEEITKRPKRKRNINFTPYAGIQNSFINVYISMLLLNDIYNRFQLMYTSSTDDLSIKKIQDFSYWISLYYKHFALAKGDICNTAWVTENVANEINNLCFFYFNDPECLSSVFSTNNIYTRITNKVMVQKKIDHFINQLYNHEILKADDLLEWDVLVMCYENDNGINLYDNYNTCEKRHGYTMVFKYIYKDALDFQFGSVADAVTPLLSLTLDDKPELLAQVWHQLLFLYLGIPLEIQS